MFKHIILLLLYLKPILKIEESMKKNLFMVGLAASVALMSFTNPSKKEDTFKVDADQSTLVWTGYKVTGSHTGNIKISSGALVTSGETIKTGNVTIDMTSITNTDLEGQWSDKLVGHLKSEDFFSTTKNPTSSLKINKVTTDKNGRAQIEGQLTIKGITNSISFPASISKKGDVLVAVATIKVDRTKYNIQYRSESFFENLGDKAIDNNFELQVNLVAKK